jgi:uncharacterized protein Usg
MTIILAQYRLTTAHIIYRRPDHLWLLQEYVWQEVDRVPGFPALRKFLDFWRRELAGPIHSVVVADADLALDNLIRTVDDTMTLQ